MATKKAANESKPEWQPIPKMALKAMGSNGKEAVKQGKNVYMGRIYGEAQAVKTKENRSGDMYSYLVGEFRSINGNGEKFESGILYLPGKLFETVESMLKSADGKAVRFAYDIYSTVDEKSSVGYSYAAKTLIKTEASNRLEEMTAELTEKK
jgi:hypothetical protein